MTACIVVRYRGRPVSYIALNTDPADPRLAALTLAYPGDGYSVAIEQLAP